MSTIPVICDRCRATGTPGQGDFSHLGDLLDFEPVPRKTQRVDGWNEERQRAFIAALSATGSKRRAAMAIGMASYGVDQLLKSEGSDSFKAAFERAIAIARQNGSMKIATGVADAAARNAIMQPPPSRLHDYSPPAGGRGRGWAGGSDHDDDEDEWSAEQKLEVIESIVKKYLRKVQAEREARLDGRIVEADFYLRQITVVEVSLDLLAECAGFSGFELLKSAQRDGHNVFHIAETPFSRMLDEERRKQWRRAEEPERPEHPPQRYLEDHGSYSLEPSRSAFGALTPPAAGFSQEQWATMNHDEQHAARQAEFAREAEAQVEWEAKARREYESRCDSTTRT